MKFTKTLRDSQGQSLVETLLTLPILMIVLLNSMNFGYFFLVALNVTSAPRNSIEYGIQGFDTVSAQSLPPANPPGTNTTISYATYQDMTGALNNPTGASLQICTPVNIDTTASPPSGTNGTGASRRANCVTCTGSTCTAPAAVTTGNLAPRPDPESPSFILQRVDVTYTFPPLLNVPGFTIPLSWLPFCSNVNGNCTVTRHAEMRTLN